MNPIFAIACAVAGFVWLFWGSAPFHRLVDKALHLRRNERGETSISIALIAVCLIASITVLAVTDKAVPDALTQAFSGLMIGIAGGEAGDRAKKTRASRKATK